MANQAVNPWTVRRGLACIGVFERPAALDAAGGVLKISSRDMAQSVHRMKDEIFGARR